jgi:hypothetical protein
LAPCLPVLMPFLPSLGTLSSLLDTRPSYVGVETPRPSFLGALPSFLHWRPSFPPSFRPRVCYALRSFIRYLHGTLSIEVHSAVVRS